MFRWRIVWSSVLMLCVISAVLGQDAQCPAIVETALKTVSDACQDIGRNQLCYGNVNVRAIPRGDVQWTFEKSGDTVSVTDLQSLTLAPLSETKNQWGISLMRIQANLPDTLPGQNVTFLMFGDVAVTNVASDLSTLTVTAKRNINVRLRPTTQGNNVIGSLTAGDKVTAVGRLEDTSWIQVRLTDGAQGYGWVSAPLVESDGDLATLAVMQADETAFGAMQAFTFKTGLGDSGCAEAPNSGILIQTPKGAGRVTLQANGIDINLGSTAYLQAGEGFATISVLEGSGRVSADGVTQNVPGGTFTHVPLGDDGLANGAPERAQAYNLDDLQALPISLGLPEVITIAEPLIVTTTSPDSSSPGGGSAAPSAPGG